MEVTTAQGLFRGARNDGVWSFKGIPYAAAPVGALRFAAPVPPPAHSGIADGTRYGATVAAPPQRSEVLDRLIPDPIRPGDNPLNLNVWTPDLSARLPVLVWIHGGGFVTGTGSTTIFDGYAFARDGVVTVTINYRLGVEGFLHLTDAPPNRGLLDQIAALTWVRDNISSFGGDPDAVTIAGESAGAMSVCTLLTMPSARGLFIRAISQSGDGHHVHAPDIAEMLTTDLCARLAVPPTAVGVDSIALADLHRVTNEVIGATAATDERSRAFTRLAFQPVVDGTVLPEHPATAARAAATNGVALLIGANSDEYGLFTAPTGLAQRMTEDVLRGSVARLVDTPDEVIERYRSALPHATTAELYVAIQSDWFCTVPATRFVDSRRAAGADCHMYQFSWQPNTFNGQLGSCHTLEIPFVFDTLDDPWGIELRGKDAPQSLADEIHHAWVDFVVSGRPGWDFYGEARRVCRFDLASEVVLDPDSFRRSSWDGLI